ncbi:MAG: hypothetical protein L0226_08745 [Acidobacteria bacterium]|nr:hypothetical protein [Acidobacteriota bacterium]
MKPVLEQKLRELIDEADRQIDPAMSTVLHLLLGACKEGKQNNFAKHCTKFSPIFMTGMAIQTKDDEEDGWPNAGSKTFVN